MPSDILKSVKNTAFGVVSFQHLNIFNTRSKARIPQNASCAIAFVFPYYNKSAFDGNISAYCSVADYHIVVMEQLKSIISDMQSQYPDNNFVPFVDASPIDEVDLAVKAGLGIKGKNSLLITEKWGSYVFIGEIVTDLEMDTVCNEYKMCAECNACVKTCPGNAIGDGVVCTEKCASFISQKKGELSGEEREILHRARTVFGCDICQKVCPHNKNIAEEENLFSGDIYNAVTEKTLERIYKERAFGFRGLKVLERNLEIYDE